MFNRKNIQQLSDEALLKRYLEGGQSDYFGELYNRYIPMLFGVGLKYLQDEYKSQDAVMQVFEYVFQKIKEYDVDNFRTWIYSVMKNYCLMQIKRERNVFVEINANTVEADEVLLLLNENGENDERVPVLKKAIRQLPQEQRVAIEKFFYENMSYQDIAETAFFDLKKVKSYIQNGKRNLKNFIEKNIE